MIPTSKKVPAHHFSKTNIFSHDTSPEDIDALHTTFERGEHGIQTFGTTSTIGGDQDDNYDLDEGEGRAVGGMADSQRLKALMKNRKEARKVEEKKAAKEKSKSKPPAKKIKTNEGRQDMITKPKRKYTPKTKVKKFSKTMGTLKTAGDDESQSRPAKPKPKRGQQARKEEKAGSTQADIKTHSANITTAYPATDTEEQSPTPPPKKRLYSQTTDSKLTKPTTEPNTKRKRTPKQQLNTTNSKQKPTKKSQPISKPSTKIQKTPIHKVVTLTEQRNMQDHFNKAMEGNNTLQPQDNEERKDVVKGYKEIAKKCGMMDNETIQEVFDAAGFCI